MSLLFRPKDSQGTGETKGRGGEGSGVFHGKGFAVCVYDKIRAIQKRVVRQVKPKLTAGEVYAAEMGTVREGTGRGGKCRIACAGKNYTVDKGVFKGMLSDGYASVKDYGSGQGGILKCRGRDGRNIVRKIQSS